MLEERRKFELFHSSRGGLGDNNNNKFNRKRLHESGSAEGYANAKQC